MSGSWNDFNDAKQNSNIIGLVPALELKKEHMVKLPVIVYNQHHRHEVIENALHLRQRLQATGVGHRFLAEVFVPSMQQPKGLPRLNEIVRRWIVRTSW